MIPYPAPANPAPAGPTPVAAPKPALKAVTCCVHHADFLAHTLPINRVHFDRYIVVTAPEDRDTQRVCKTWGVECVVTDAFRSHWGEFHKGAGINKGLAKLDIQSHDWLVHHDADIVFPGSFRHSLETAELDPTMIYGVDRYEFKSYADWQRFFASPAPLRDNMFVDLSHVEGVRLGTRIAFDHHHGYVPIGFTQIWNAASGVVRYPEGHANAGREDTLFAALWPRRKRGFIPEVVVYHLESEFAPMAVNWKTRVTKKFSI